MYDSTQDTEDHIEKVDIYLRRAAKELMRRGYEHDGSKLEYPEKELFDKWTPILKNLEYGSEEYAASLKELNVALEHHYAHNSHHPQHYINGIDGMDLFDVIEMFFDWKAAGERDKNGNIFKSIAYNKERFKMSDQLVNIFNNTANKLWPENKS